MSHKTKVYPIFLPHVGCPFQCVYCNQKKVTAGSAAPFFIEDVERYCRERLLCLEAERHIHDDPVELAFYGGTFTGLPEDTLRSILDDAQRLVEKNILSGIRFSTRPDYITPATCSVLADYAIHVVELGVQSFDEAVLTQNRRGYGVEVVERAAELIGDRQWTLGIQLMLGLPGDEPEKFLGSVRKAVSLGGTLLRFYPALVLEDTLLAQWYRQGLYRPLDLEDAVKWCVPAYDLLRRAGIPPIRMGLQADRELERPGAILAGPYHPAFGYLVRAAWWRQRVDDAISSGLSSRTHGASLSLTVPERFVSEVLGHRRENVAHWRNAWKIPRVSVQGDPGLDDRDMVLDWQSVDINAVASISRRYDHL